MGFEEFFETNRTNYKYNKTDNQRNDNEYSDNSEGLFNGNSNNILLQNFLEKIRNNKKLKLFVVLAGIMILIIVIVLIIVLFPLIKNLINYITQNGLQGVVDEITGFINNILNGKAN
jgi:hypothetical protein